MYLTGFADEAAPDLAGQIRATRELGWHHIEARSVDGINIHDLPAAAFDKLCTQLADTGITINCFGSTIANWGKSIDDPPDTSLAEARRAIPRMQRLGTKLVRIMSFGIRPGLDPEEQMAEERFSRLRHLVDMFTTAGITPVHENCMNYGGMGWTFTLELLEQVPGLKLVFDTGNPVFTDDRTKPKPYPKQDSWEFYSRVKDHIAYIHIKDCRFIREVPGEIFPESQFTFPGEGNAQIEKILKDLLHQGYTGGISIEPHMAAVFHDPTSPTDTTERFNNYVTYGRCLETLLTQLSP